MNLEEQQEQSIKIVVTNHSLKEKIEEDKNHLHVSNKVEIKDYGSTG